MRVRSARTIAAPPEPAFRVGAALPGWVRRPSADHYQPRRLDYGACVTETNVPEAFVPPLLDAGSQGAGEAAASEIPLPADLGAGLDPTLRVSLHQMLLTAPGQLRTVYRAMVQHPGAGPTELLPHTDCANAGVVGNRRVIVLAIMNGTEPTSASVARQAGSTVGTLLKQSTDADVKAYLLAIRAMLDAKAVDAQAVEAEDQQLQSDSATLESALRQASGVYVYTYPHYWKYPYDPDTDRRLLKVGRTTNQAWGRVLNQARQTGMPEDPLLLRVFETDDPNATERAFHMLLDAAQHHRSTGTAVGQEWFSSTLEFCDAVATVLKLVIHKGAAEE